MQMQEQNAILSKLSEIVSKLEEQNILQKIILNLSEAAKYLDISESHLYKLTSSKQIPHFCPQGKKLYFRREELDNWLQRNRQSSTDEIETAAANYMIRNKRK
jgi:excisionase family DNA binding protein